MTTHLINEFQINYLLMQYDFFHQKLMNAVVLIGIIKEVML